MVLTLRKPKSSKKVEWAEDTVDNEHLGRKKSKCRFRSKRDSVGKDGLAHYLLLFIQVVAYTGSRTSLARARRNPRTRNVITAKDTLSSRVLKAIQSRHKPFLPHLSSHWSTIGRDFVSKSFIICHGRWFFSQTIFRLYLYFF